MPDAISNTSPLVYLHRIGVIEWLPQLFNSIWLPTAVATELQTGQRRGYDVPNPQQFRWLEITDPQAVPQEWLALDLGVGELNALALTLENQSRVVLLDDARARKVGQAAGLTVWGTLKILLEAKAQNLTPSVAPHVTRLSASGMFISTDIRERILKLAGEDAGGV